MYWTATLIPAPRRHARAVCERLRVEVARPAAADAPDDVVDAARSRGYVSCTPAKLASAASSATALERTATAGARGRARVRAGEAPIAATRSSGLRARWNSSSDSRQPRASSRGSSRAAQRRRRSISATSPSNSSCTTSSKAARRDGEARRDGKAGPARGRRGARTCRRRARRLLEAELVERDRRSVSPSVEDRHRPGVAVDAHAVARLDRFVACPVPTTAGSPYSRATIAAWDIIPPMSETAAAIFGNTGPSSAPSPSRRAPRPAARRRSRSTSRTTRATPSTTPGDAA